MFILIHRTNFYQDVLHSITLWCTIRYRTMLMIAMSLFCLKHRLGMYFRHLELRGSKFNKSLQERASNDISGPLGNFSKMLCWGCRLKRTRKRTGKRTGLSSRRFVRLSEQCSLKRTFISPEVQKSYFWYKNLNSKLLRYPLHPETYINSIDPLHGNN